MADTPKFTPGPWTVGDDWRDITAASGRLLIVHGYASSRTGVTLPANARLIAAAPDLYEALKAFADHFGPLEDNHMLNDDCRRCFRLARDAFAKAEGRS